MGADIYRRTLISGIIQIVIGVLCILFGIAEIMSVLNGVRITLSVISFVSIWGGVWILVTGFIGRSAIRQRTSETPSCMCSYSNGGQVRYAVSNWNCGSFRCTIGVYMGFSISATVIAALIISVYAINLNRFHYDSEPDPAIVTISLFMLIFGIGAFVVTIWAAICCSAILCGGQNPQMAPVGTVVYTQTQCPPAVYDVAQGPDGTPVAIPARPMTEPGGTPVNNPDEPAAVPPHYNFDADGEQTAENTAL